VHPFVVLNVTFKARLDKFWQHQAVKFDFTADLTGTGNLSEEVKVILFAYSRDGHETSMAETETLASPAEMRRLNLETRPRRDICSRERPIREKRPMSDVAIFRRKNFDV